MAERHIVGLGGGGFSMGSRRSPIDDYIVGLARRLRPKIAFIPAAAGDADSLIVRFYEAFPATSYEPSHLRLFRRNHPDMRAYLLAQDIIYVAGGHTANLIALMRLHGLDVMLREAWQAGVVLAGVSAGSMCWFEAGVIRSTGACSPLPHGGLGFLKGGNCPHYSSEPDRRAALLDLVAEHGFPASTAVDDDAAVHYAGDALAEVVAEHPQRRAYRVELVDGKVVETPLAARLLLPH
jgi:dipeptidase E